MENKGNKNKIVAIICGITGIVLIASGYFFNQNQISNNFFTNDDYNINNNGGSVAVKIDDHYYVMGKSFFVKIDKNNNIVTNIGKENNISSFDYNPYMQVYGDYIYYAVGGYYKNIYRYNYKNNTIELYTEITEAISESAIVSTYFIRGDKLFYQPYSKKYYYSINLKNNSTEKIENSDLYAYITALNFENNMYGDNIIYTKNKNLNYLDVSKNEVKTVISHDCDNFIVYNNQIYYEYNSAIYKSNIDGTDETLIYDGDYSDFMTIYKNYLYVSKGYSAKIIDISTGEEINNIQNCINYSIAVDKFICTDYRNNNAYSYNLDGSNQQLIYDNSKITTEDSKDNINNTVIKDETTENNEESNNNTDNTINNPTTGNKDESVSNSIKFTADVHFLTKAEGGLHTPFFPGKVFQYQFGNSSMYDGSIKFPSDVEMISPGDDVVLTITISANESISAGTEFTVYKDSERIIGNGIVKEIIK